MVTSTYDLNVQPGGLLLSVPVSQYDVGSRQLVFNLYTDDGSLSLPSGVQAEVRGTKPDGNGFSYSASVSGTSVTVNITQQMTAVAGKTRCEIVLYKGTYGSSGYYQLATANFVMVVERAALDKDTPKSNSEIRELINVLDRTDEIIAAGRQSDNAATRIAEMEQSAKRSAQEASAALDEITEISNTLLPTAHSAKQYIDMQLDDALAEMSLERQNDLLAINVSFTRKLQELNDTHAENMEEMRRLHNTDITAWREEYAGYTSELREALANALSEINRVYNGDVQAINEQHASNMEEMRQAYSNDIAALQSKYKEDMDSLEDAIETAIANINEKRETIINDVDTTVNEKMEALLIKFSEIIAVKTVADNTAATALNISQSANDMSLQAMQHATEAANKAADNSSRLDDAETEQESIKLQLMDKIDGAYVEDGYLYLTSGNDVVVGKLGPFSGGGGGGGGTSGNSATITLQSTTGWTSQSVAQTAEECWVTFRWSSIENELETGPGTLKVVVSGSTKAIINIPQGDNNINVRPYLNTGANTVSLTVEDIYGNNRTIRMTVTVVALSLSSSFDATAIRSSAFNFMYTAICSAEKTMYILVDDEVIATRTDKVSGTSQSIVVPQQTHGRHVIRAYFEANINGQLVPSNEVYYEFIYVDALATAPILTSTFRVKEGAKYSQYDMLSIDFTAYTPDSEKSTVFFVVNGNYVNDITVDRDSHSFEYRMDNYGQLEIKIYTGTPGTTDYAELNWTLEVSETDINVSTATEQLVLELTAAGRSNDEALATRSTWNSGNIEAILTGFNWRINGWMRDNDGATMLRLYDSARVTIPYKIFGSDFKENGKTIEIDFATQGVVDYNANILSCIQRVSYNVWDAEAEEMVTKYNDLGIRITPQTVYFSGAQTSIAAPFKEDEHLRVTIVVGKQVDDARLMLVYINGVISGAIQYASGERFTQDPAQNITIGNDDCGIDIYSIRVYDRALSDTEVLNNWIADSPTGALRQDRYIRNNIIDANTNSITPDSLPAGLPYMVFESDTLPVKKSDDDKAIVSGRYIDPADGTKSFSFEGCQVKVQGTSSSVYFRKNWDCQFKSGFNMLSNNARVNAYALTNNSIAFNRFVLKADVASSEGANNVVLVDKYDSTCPYQPPEMVQNPKIRWGIEGIPIVLFWTHPDPDNSSVKVTEFMGKYNFNLPKRAPGPYGYSGNMESWEVQWNNSDNVVFHTSDYTSTKHDAIEDKTYPAWRDDFEARFPSDEWTNIAKLKELTDFLVSTWRDGKTGETLDEPKTFHVYGTSTFEKYPDDKTYTVVEELDEDDNGTGYYDITFTADTEAYRLTRFKSLFPEYAEIQSMVFYWLFTEEFLMIDSRAKNMFIGFRGSNATGLNAIDRKATAEPYDMDTAIGIDNSGNLTFGYTLEDTDTISTISGGGSDSPVFHAHDSALWCNLRDAFRSEIVQMYRSLRSSGAWSYNAFEQAFEDHQSKWSEAIFNEDARVKYIYPLFNATPDPEQSKDANGNIRIITTDYYLPMAQGNKQLQRRWWLYNRFRYTDSKYLTGNAESNVITVRLYASGTLNIKTVMDLYVNVRFGQGNTPEQRKVAAGEVASFPFVFSANEMETSIYSADLIADLGDLSVFYPKRANFSMASRLQNIKLSDPARRNTNLDQLDVSNCPLLETLDCRYCTALNKPVDLSNSPRLKEAYFEGSVVTGVDFADGATVNTIHLPGTITSLRLFNLDKLEELTVESYGGITQLMLANISSQVLNPATVLSSIAPGSEVYIEGLNLELADAAAIEAFFTLLDSHKGVTRNRVYNSTTQKWEWVYHSEDTAHVSGTIHTNSLTGAQIASYNDRYPFITVTADHTSSYLYYYNWDGSELLHTDTILDGGDGTWNGTPTRTQTAQYTFTFKGWSTSKDATAASANATKSVVADRVVYAAYSRTTRKYTVTFKNDNGTTLQTVNNVAYGTTPSYTGSTPTSSDSTMGDFNGWAPALGPITGNTTYTATYASPVEVAEITDDWATIIDNIENGLVQSKYKIGNYKALDLGTEGTVNMQIVAFDTDVDAEGNTVPMTMIAKDCLVNTKMMNSWSTANGGYPGTEVMRPYLENTVLPNISATVSAHIVMVSKTSQRTQPSVATLTNNLKIWLPSHREISNGNPSGSCESSGCIYSKLFKDNTSRIKKKYGTDSACDWWLRTGSGNKYFLHTKVDGTVTWGNASDTFGVVPGFCLGPDTIHDTWDEISAHITAGDYATVYSIGDTKAVDMGDQGVICMQIAAFDADVDENGNTIPITWVAKQALVTKHNMNSSSTNAGGYPASAMKTYVDGLESRMPATLKSMIKPAVKTSFDYNDGTTRDLSTAMRLWIPSEREIYGGTDYEKTGPIYSTLFKDYASKIKKIYGGTAGYWWLRSASSTSDADFRGVRDTSARNSFAPSYAYGVVLGFCTGAATT